MIDIRKDRAGQLKDLLETLADKINEDPGARDMAQLAKQYRETLKEIEELEGNDGAEDEIGKLLNE